MEEEDVVVVVATVVVEVVKVVKVVKVVVVVMKVEVVVGMAVVKVEIDVVVVEVVEVEDEVMVVLVVLAEYEEDDVVEVVAVALAVEVVKVVVELDVDSGGVRNLCVGGPTYKPNKRLKIFNFSTLTMFRKIKVKRKEQGLEAKLVIQQSEAGNAALNQMWRKAIATTARGVGALHHPWRTIAHGHSTAVSPSDAVNSILLRSLKEHYLDVTKMNPPPKINPPSPFTVVQGSLDGNGPALKRTFGDEEITISVMRLANIVPGDGGEDDGADDGDDINQLFLHVDVSKPGQKESLHFLCGLYPDALGIHSVSMRPKADAASSVEDGSSYTGPVFEDLEEKIRDAFHNYIEERGVGDSLFPFLRAWLYVKDHRNLMRWFKSVGTFINENKTAVKDS
ncbi:PREDICTED: At2g39795 [Prunus dulcis]|uniref:PREDICTED: At2g39795 n=2 Tax=Prunus dulcis TaxID=3755 RepID=A0A5E4GF18_PRUDU|nr:PREDICTED: At2g39795 [Prunus dulcis]